MGSKHSPVVLAAIFIVSGSSMAAVGEWSVFGPIGPGTLRPTVGRVFALDDMVDAHRCMEENRAGGKIVILM